MLTPKETTEFTQHLVDQGKLIEAGWEGFKMMAYPNRTQQDPEKIDQLRNVFFAGAQHLFACIVTVLDDDAEPTVEDLQRMNSIHLELSKFLDEFKLKYLTPAQGQS